MIDDVEQLGVLHESVGAGIGHVNDELADMILLGHINEVERQVDLGTLAETSEHVGILDRSYVVLLRDSTGDVTYIAIEIDAIELECIGIDTSHESENENNNFFHN